MRSLKLYFSAILRICRAQLAFARDRLRLTKAPAPCAQAPAVIREDLQPPRRLRKWLETFPADQNLPNVSLIHIGKCGGTSIMRSFLEAGVGLAETHVQPTPVSADTRYILWVRDPVARYVSAFNHSKALVAFDISGLDPDHVSFANSPAPGRIRRKILSGGLTFTRSYEFLLAKFDTANDLAEALYGPSVLRRLQAHMLIRMPDEHLWKGIGWYLLNGAWVEKFHRNILMVGDLSRFAEDWERLCGLLGLDPGPELLNIRENKIGLSKDLSPRARANIERFYRNTDYRALTVLARYGLR